MYALFNRVRSVLVTRFASDAVLDIFNDLTYGATSTYKPEEASFRSELFHWEVEALERALPRPPARVLVGGAGGGREPFALAARGYEVVAFDPSPQLAQSMAARAGAAGRVTALLGRYEDLPSLQPLSAGTPAVDLRALGPFDAAIFGWSSYSHIRHRAARVRALQDMAAVTRGAIILSFYYRREAAARAPSGLKRIAERLGLASANSGHFSMQIGYYRFDTRPEMHDVVREAGLEVVHECYDDMDGRWPYMIVRRPAESAAPVIKTA